MNVNLNNIPFDLPSNFKNLTLQEILNKLLPFSEGQPASTVFRLGDELISFNFTKVPISTQDNNNKIKNNDHAEEEHGDKKIQDINKTKDNDEDDSEENEKDRTKIKDKENNKEKIIEDIKSSKNNENYQNNLKREDQVLNHDKEKIIEDYNKNIQKTNNKENDPFFSLQRVEIPLENSDSLVQHISDKEDTKQFIGISNCLPALNLNKWETYPSNNKTIRLEQRHLSLDSKKEIFSPSKPSPIIKSFSQKTFTQNESGINPISMINQNPIDFEVPNTRKYSNDFDFSLSISKDSFSARKFDPNKLKINKGEYSFNINRETSLNLAKGISFNNYRMSSEENENKRNPIIFIDHESFNTMDFNVSKTDSKSGSPSKKILNNEPLNLDKLITIENQASFKEEIFKPFNAKSCEFSNFFQEEMDLEKLEISKSVYINDEYRTSLQPPPTLKEDLYSSPLGISKRTDDSSENKRYNSKKNLKDQSSSNLYESLQKSNEDFSKEDLLALHMVEEILNRTDKKSKTYHHLEKTLKCLKKYQEQLVSKEIVLNSREVELFGFEKTLKEKERKLNEMLEKTSKSSTQLSLETLSMTNNKKDPLKELLEEQMSEGGKRQKFEIPSDAEIHFLFLYSSPLITYFKDSEGKVGKRPICNEIDYQTELKKVQDILISSQREIKFMSVPASLERMSMSLDKNPLALHFCGHGVRNNEETFGISYDQKEGDFLILEDEEGAAYFMSSKNLEKLLSKLKNQLYFVFVASCHSKIVGEVFLKAGALHVICVKREERILDSACQIFSKAFYHACLTGKKTICQAFAIAKDQVRLNETMPPGEENKFVLLVKEEDDIYSDHNCIGWVDAGPGSFIDLNERPEFNQIPSQIENFMGRNEVMHDLLCLILTSRFVTLKGIAGIGKSSLAKETIRYIYERKHFRNGVIYINMNGCESREAVMGSLNARIYGSHQYVESRKENGGKMVQQIVEHLRDKEALIVFDNVMDLMLVNEKEKEKFQLFIDLLLSNCNDIKVLITSRTPLGDGPLADYAEKIINLGPLIEEDSKNLLLARAPRIIDNEEIDELMNLEINVNYGIPQDKKKEFVGHAFFDLFGGHPQAITLAASLLDEKRLKEVFLHLEENSVIHVYDYGSEVSERDKKSFNSLRCSLDISWESLSKKNANAARLLSFLGLFPAGIQEEELEILWEKNFKLECEVLLRSSFLRKTHKDSTIHYSLFPFMAKYAEEHLSQIEKRDHHEKILQHFAKSIEEYYKTIGTISKNAEKSLNELIRYELNIRACIFREISYQGNEDLEKSLYDSFNLNTSNIRINERFKDIEAIKEDEEDEFFPLTKTNIQMHQKRFDMNKGSLKQNPSLSIHSIRSSSPIYITENMANQLKTPKAKTGVWENNFYNYNVSQSENFMIKAFAFNEGGANSASLESRNNCELIDAIDRYSSTPEPEMLRIGGDLYKISRPTIKNNVCLNSDMLLCLEKKDSQSKNTPKFFKNKDNNNLLEEKDESPLMFDNYSKETEKKVVKILLENTPIEKSTSIKEPQPVKINSSYNEVTARFSKDSFGSVNNSQEIYANMKSGSKNYHQKSNYIKKSNSGLSYSGQVLPINRLIIYYVSILFLLRRYVEAIKMLKYGLRIADINNDILAKANYYRILGVVGHLKKHYTKSLEDFQRARDLFSRVNCYIGVAISEAAMGYVKFSENSQLSQAKEHLEKSLKLYEQLEHSFGIHFLNKWLGSLKKKIPHLKHQSKLHFHEMNKIKDIKKDECIISTHKGGFFVLRWMGDPISLLLEAPLNASLKKKSTKDSFNNEKVKKTEDISDNEIKSLSKNMKLKIDSSIDLENNSATLDDSSNNKTPLDILRNNFFQEGDEILTNIPLFGSFSKETSFPINQSNNSNKKVKEGKPPQKPKTTNVGKNNKQS